MLASVQAHQSMAAVLQMSQPAAYISATPSSALACLAVCSLTATPRRDSSITHCSYCRFKVSSTQTLACIA